MASQWYCQLDDGIRGPMTSTELAALAKRGKLRPEHMVRKESTEGASGWVAARTVKGFVFSSEDPGSATNRASDTTAKLDARKADPSRSSSSRSRSTSSQPSPPAPPRQSASPSGERESAQPRRERPVPSIPTDLDSFFSQESPVRAELVHSQLPRGKSQPTGSSRGANHGIWYAVAGAAAVALLVIVAGSAFWLGRGGGSDRSLADARIEGQEHVAARPVPAIDDAANAASDAQPTPQANDGFHEAPSLPVENEEEEPPKPAPAKPERAKPKRRSTKASNDVAAVTSSSTPLSTEDLVERSEQSVALIAGKQAIGTGFLARPGILVTNAHVISQDAVDSLRVHFPSAADGKKGPLAAKLLCEDQDRDLAVLRVATDLPALPVAQQYRFRRGQDVVVIGNPGIGGALVLENAVSRGVASTEVDFEGQHFYQMGVSVNPGNSGGPVFTYDGQIVGVVTRKASEEEGVAFCIPVEDVNNMLATAERQTPQQVQETESRHLSLVVGAMSVGAGVVYETLISASLEEVIDPNARRTGREPLSSFGEAGAEALQKAGDLLDSTKQLFTEASNQHLLPPEATHILVQLLNSCEAIRAHLNQPMAGTIVYQRRGQQLLLGHRQIMSQVKSSLGDS